MARVSFGAGGGLGSGEPVHIVGLDHVQVVAPVGSERDARRFYASLLGLPELKKPLALRDRGGSGSPAAANSSTSAWQAIFAREEGAPPALRVRHRNLDLIAERLTAAGGTVQCDGAIPGTPKFYTADPWGNRVELVAAG